MSKELEALERGILEFEKELEYDCNNEWLKRVIAGMKKCYQRLEAIDTAEPSEALECLEYLYSEPYDYGSIEIDRAKDYNDIKNYILKTQEPKKYLKWEDLDTKPYTVKVKMGDNLYMLDWRYSNDDDYDNSKLVTLRTLDGDWLFTLEKYFFSDLQLEVIENE